MDLELDPDRTAALHLQLIDEQDRGRRAGMHLELASLAVRDGNIEQAARHFREALWHEPTLERARAGLRDLGEQVNPQRPRKSILRMLMTRLRGARPADD